MRSFCLSSSAQVLPLDVTTPSDSCAGNYRELVNLLALSESLAEVGLESVFKPLSHPEVGW